MMTKPTVGLITYHAAYNFGSVLQAYATQRTIESFGYPVEMIDYRTYSQIYWYHHDIRHLKTWKSKAEVPLFLMMRSKRKERARKFEDFISSKMNLTAKRYIKFEDFIDFNYEILVSGSDQIWNINCGEFRYEPYDSIRPYFLDFGHPKKRIAYASSFGAANREQVQDYTELLKQYDFLSTREPRTRDFMAELTGKNVELVCDPTWLLNREEWSQLISKSNHKKPYILVYNLLFNWRIVIPWLRKIKKTAKILGLDVYCISALRPLVYPGVHMVNDAGPLDILQMIRDASFVVTNTFHGTIFSINFNVPFLSLKVEPNSRQDQILTLCRLGNRVANTPDELMKFNKPLNIDFTQANRVIEDFRTKSKQYLKNALDE